MKTKEQISQEVVSETKEVSPAPATSAKLIRSNTIEDLQERLAAIENYLSADVRAGSKEETFMPYNGVKKSPGKFYGGTDNPNTNATGFRLNYDGRFYATQMFSKAFFYTSDIAEKQNVAQLNDALDKLLSLKGVSFNWKDDNSKDAGVIAQDVERVIPEAASNIDGKYSVKASTLIAYLIESIRELKHEIDELKDGKSSDKK